jgi:glycosyltransferase involved in cell wall biosynthesis
MYDISIAVPTFNSAKYLENTLFSIAHQIGCNPEVIVADSGSMDETLNICGKYSIKTIFIPPGNIYSAINEALSICESPWLTFLNSDDIVYPNSYARLIRCGERQNAEIVYGSCDYIDEEGRYLHSYLPGYPNELRSQFLTSDLSFAQPASIFQRQVFSQLNGFDEQYNLTSDLDFYIRSVFAGYKFAMLEGRTVCGFRISSLQLSQQTNKMKAQNDQVRQKYSKATIKDFWVTRIWKMRNWPNYLIRLLRYKVLTGTYRFVKSTDVYNYEN